jgi:non-ribosomal peptide synthetase component F
MHLPPFVYILTGFSRHAKLLEHPPGWFCGGRWGRQQQRWHIREACEVSASSLHSDDGGNRQGEILNSVNLADVFVGLASRWPDRSAIISPHLTLTYSQLVARAAQSARELRLHGIVARAKVGIGIRDSAETVVLLRTDGTSLQAVLPPTQSPA